MASYTKEEHKLWQALKPLQTTLTFLNTGAHPDDERSDLLSYLAQGIGVETVAVIANRGEGGQNEIGQESGNTLGILRTKEMAAAAAALAIDAVHLSETLQDPIYDYGIEKTAEATLKKWGKTRTYERLIRHIRQIKPDIVMPSFRDNDQEHGHHRAITTLTLQAFQDAANPEIFPEQLQTGIKAWQIKKMYLPAEDIGKETCTVNIGELDPIYKATYPQLGEQARTFHRTQGMGKNNVDGIQTFGLELVHSIVNNPDTDHLFADLPFNLHDYAQYFSKTPEIQQALHELQDALDQIVGAFPNRSLVFKRIEAATGLLAAVIDLVTAAKIETDITQELLHKLQRKQVQLNKAGLSAAKITIEPIIESAILTRGQRTAIAFDITNNSTVDFPILDAQLNVPANWKVNKHLGENTLPPNTTVRYAFTVDIAKDAALHHPYEHAPIAFVMHVGTTASTLFHQQLALDQLVVLPDIAITCSPEQIVINTKRKRDIVPLKIKMKHYRSSETTAKLAIDLPDGWKLISQVDAIHFTEQQEEKELDVLLLPPADAAASSTRIELKAVNTDQIYSQQVQEISYDHVGTLYHVSPAVLQITSFALRQPRQLEIGYIESGFDHVADALLAAGFRITKLTEMDLAVRDLQQYDTIVIGIRAYLARKDLQLHHQRLMQYVENGGHLVVQYHKPTDGLQTPYPFTLGTPSIRWRVADETASMKITKPTSPLFSFPNRINPNDWDDWVQERGLYFPMAWSDQYETVIQVADQDEAALDSGILVANYGKGTYLYTNLIFHRQIQNQLPGAYRMFTNLLSYGKAQMNKNSKTKDEKRIS